MTSRRSFLRTLSGGGAMATLVSRARAASANVPLGFQLYSVRDQLARDVPGTLKQVKAWGFDEVEGYGPYGASLAAAFKDAGLHCGALHVDYERLTSDLAGVLKDADTLGARTIVNPYLPLKSRPYATREEILKAAGDFAGWSKACREAGKRFAYHIHGHEFGKTDTGTLFDALANESGPEVGFEADVFWVMVGGADPVVLMRRFPGRFWFTHLKDMAKGTLPAREGQDFDRASVALGAGVIDIPAILAASAEAGVELHYLEDESPDVLAQVPRSVAFYRGL